MNQKCRYCDNRMPLKVCKIVPVFIEHYRSADIVRGSIPDLDRPKSIKQEVTAPLVLLNVRQQVLLSRVLGDDLYKGLVSVTVDLAR